MRHECSSTEETIVGPTRQYEAPAVVAREKIGGLLTATRSDDPGNIN